MRIIDDRVRLSASDVANFLACRHLARLDLLRARGVITPAHACDAGFEDLVKRGEAHEKEVLQRFRDRGLTVVEIPPSQGNVAAGAATAIFRSAVSRASCSISARTTSSPARAKRSASAKPMPLAAPVTTAAAAID